jgi:hypothetical protein
MCAKRQVRLAVAGLLGAAVLLAQDAPIPVGSINIKFPKDSPLALLQTQTDQSRASARGAALVLDLQMALSLRNISQNRIHGVTLRVVSQEVTMGGKGSVSYPSLDVAPGEAFPVSIKMQLVRPTQVTGGPLVEVNLDGVLFQDLSFYGPDKLDSKRKMTAWEMEAQRDRAYYKRILAQGGRNALQQEILASLNRQSQRPQLGVRVRTGQAVTSAAMPASEHTAQFAFLKFPDAPVEPVEGWAQLAGNEVRAPRIQVVNKSNKPVKYVELGWLVKDQGGQQFMASLPSADPDLFLPPGKRGRVLQETTLQFERPGQPVNVESMTGFVSQVEFADGKVWVPNRQNLENAMLLNVLAPSVEEQRLTDLYRKRGIDGLVAELNRF